MKIKSSFFLWLTYLLFMLCLLPVARFTYKHPAYNFDMLGYVALIVRMDKTSNLDEVHKITYAAVKQEVSAEQYERLTSTPSFRKNFETDPSRFKQLLPIYIVKPLYIWAARGFYKSGFTLTAATVMPSIIAYLMIGIFLFHWLRKYLGNAAAFLGGLFIMLSIFMVGIAGLSTPDCLSALFLFLASYFILEKRNLLWMFIFFLLSIFTRVDNVITCFFIISFLTFSPAWKWISKPRYLLMLGILAVSYMIIMLPVKQFGWEMSFYSQYARQIDFSRDFNQPVNSLSYFSLLYSKLITALISTHFTFFLFLALLVMAGPGALFRRITLDQALLSVLMCVLIFRFLLLPDLSDRFYLGFYLIIIMLLTRKISQRTLPLNNEDR